MKFLTAFVLTGLTLTLAGTAWARGGGDHGMQFGASLMTASQENLNTYLDSRTDARPKSLGAGYEFFFDYGFRFSSSIFALKFRPSYFMQSAEGGNISTSMTGLTFFPFLRMYPLENNFMKFFLQVGIGYGRLSGSIKDSNSTSLETEFAGGAFGAMGGLGAEFCFTDSHCLTIEGNVRYLPIERNVVSGGNGATAGSITQNTKGLELESYNADLGTSLSGIQGIIAYQMYF
jgi:hypothetical protein